MRNRSYVVWFMLVAMCTFSMWLSTTTYINAQNSQSTDKSEFARNLIVKIMGDNVSGSGIVFGQIGDMLFIATANHVVRRGTKEAQNLKIGFKFWFEELEAELQPKYDSDLDLAVLLVDLEKSHLNSNVLSEFLPITQLYYVPEVQAGGKLYPVGHPPGKDWFTPISPPQLYEVEGENIRFDFLCDQGYSGGGLFDGHWGLVGMVIQFNPPLCEAVSFERIQETLKKWRFPVTLRSGEPTVMPTPLPTATPPSFPTATPIPLPKATPTPLPTATPIPGPSVSPIATVKGAVNSYNIAISPDGKYVLVGDESSNVVTFATSDGRILWRYELPQDNEMESGAIAVGGNLVVVGGQSGIIFSLSKQGRLLWQREVLGEVPVAMTNMGDKIFAFGRNPSKLLCYNSDGFLLWDKSIDIRKWTVWKISTSSNGEKILLQTNSDIIICDSNGNEKNFFDIVEGNYVVDTSLSPDGTKFVVLFRDGEEGAKYVALYSIRTGEIWRKIVEDYGGVAFDAQDNIFVTIKGNQNYMWDVQGKLLISWPNGGHNIGVDTEGRRCIVGKFPEATVYEVVR